MRAAALLMLGALAPAAAEAPPAPETPRERVLAGLERLALRPAPDDPQEDLRRRALLNAFRTMLREQAESRAAGSIATAAPVPPEPGVVARLSDLPAPSERPGTAPAMPRGVYRLPVAGGVVIGTGERMASGWRARGLTLAPAAGAPVIAPAAGRIAYAGPFGGYGRIVIIDHGHGWTTLLAGLARIVAPHDAAIAKGATIGTMPREAPRLTIELRHHGRPVDVTAMALS